MPALWPSQWPAFFVIVTVLLLVDLVVLQHGDRPGSPRTAWLWTAFLALLAGGFALWTAHSSGRQPAVEFITGYLIEGSLSVDNLFVFLILFRALRLDVRQQHRVLMWGILGAIVLRGVLILVGATLLGRFVLVQYLFGAILAVAAIRLLLQKPGVTPARGPVAWMQKYCLSRISGRQLAFSSLLIVIAAVELTDLMFAIDSIPAVLAVTRNPWIAFTSNIFAILGLRSLYFALAATLDRFHLLHYGLGCILAFVSFKMLAAHWIAIPAAWSLAVIAGILVLFAILSRIFAPAPARVS